METASIYVRLSKQATEANMSLEGMLADCRSLAKRHGLEVVGQHVDNGLTGAVRDRPEFKAWLADAREGRASTLIAWHADRLTREGINAAAMLLDVLEGKDSSTGRVIRPTVRLLDHSGLDSAQGDDAFRLRFVIAAEVARAERARMVARAKAGRRRLREAARFPGGTPPFGYSITPAYPGYRLTIDPEQAAQIREIAQRVLEGETVNSIVMAFNRAGVPSPADQQRIKSGNEPRGTSWRVSNLNRLLKSPTLLGLATVKTTDGKGYMVVRDDEGKPIQRAEPIFMPKDLTEIHQVLEARKGGGTPTGKRTPQPFLGVAKCACGANLYVINGRNKVPYWRCATRQQTGMCPAGNDRSISVERMLAECLEAFRVLVGGAKRTRREFIKGTDNATEVRELTLAISELMDDRAAGLYRGAEATTKYRAMLTSLENRKAALEREGSTPDRWDHVEVDELWSDWLEANADNPAAIGQVLRTGGVTFVLHPEGMLRQQSMLPEVESRPAGRVALVVPRELRERLKHA